MEKGSGPTQPETARLNEGKTPEDLQRMLEFQQILDQLQLWYPLDKIIGDARSVDLGPRPPSEK